VVGRAEVDELAKPFYRVGGVANGNGNGVGLGLSIVQAIAQAHGASVETEPRPEGGLRVSVAFPAAITASSD
jgi:signal transduction histidine kinase